MNYIPFKNTCLVIKLKIKPILSKMYFKFGSSASSSTNYFNKNISLGQVIDAASIWTFGDIDRLTKLSDINVYPNPNRGNFTVTVEAPQSDISIGIYYLLGELVKEVESNSLKSTYSIDLNVVNGVYLVKITNGGLNTT